MADDTSGSSGTAAYQYDSPYEPLSGTIDIGAVRRAGYVERQHDTGSVRLNYVVGPATGDPLVLVPAQTATWESYQKVLVPLAERFQVYAIDVRGHGKSTWTPGAYSWVTTGEDLRSFLSEVVERPAIVSGNSSGGLMALWCAANVPELSAGVVLEDAPVFSAEMPRFKERDRFVYNGLAHLVDTLGDLEHRDLADYFRGLELPVSEERTKRLPGWAVRLVSWRVRRFEERHPGQPVEVLWPRKLRLLLKSLSMFDPDFARAFVDGRFYEGLDHTDALRRVHCPMLVLHANWRRYQEHGLVGAMDDDDAARIRELVPHTAYRKIPANHVIHMFEPKQFVEAIDSFATGSVSPGS